MIGLIGIIIVLVVVVMIKKYDSEIRKSQYKKSVCVYSWMFGIALFLIQVISWIVGV